MLWELSWHQSRCETDGVWDYYQRPSPVSVFSADVGGYAQVWGYLYYELKYTASAGRSNRAMGAMYLEIGIYLEVKFEGTGTVNIYL